MFTGDGRRYIIFGRLPLFACNFVSKITGKRFHETFSIDHATALGLCYYIRQVAAPCNGARGKVCCASTTCLYTACLRALLIHCVQKHVGPNSVFDDTLS